MRAAGAFGQKLNGTHWCRIELNSATTERDGFARKQLKRNMIKDWDNK